MRVAIVRPADRPAGGLGELFGAAGRGIASAGGEAVECPVDGPDAAVRDAVLSSNAVLVLAPAVLFGLPGGVKAFLDSFLELLPRGALIPKTSKMAAGYVCVFTPDDLDQWEPVHSQLRSTFLFFGMNFRGGVACHDVKDTHLSMAARLGEALVTPTGSDVGYPPEYLEGAREFNAGRYFPAHDLWEAAWNDASGDRRRYFQALVQLAVAMHHHGRENWAGMAGLLDEAWATLDGLRPHCVGVNLDELLTSVAPWRALALARTGKPGTVTRVPTEGPEISIEGV
ncbi:MAG: DUF309 domain-containing protein [Planctomycetota bacterium]